MNHLRTIFISLIIFIAFLFYTPEATVKAAIVNPNKVYTYQHMVTDIQKLQRQYPDLIHYKVVGKSEYGRNIYAVSLGKGSATLFVNGSHHAREWLTTNLNMYMIEKYAEAYKKNQKIQGYNAKNILNSTTIWFIPMVNPDGVTLQQQGLKAFPKSVHSSLIKMNQGSKNFKRWKANGKGVDLNRQYNAGWSAIKSPTAPAYKNYKGKAPESAAETKTVLKFVSSINPEMAVSYHSTGKILFWNYKQGKSTYYRDLAYAKKIGSMTGYRLIYPGKNPSGGGFTDWFIHTKKKPAFTPEISRSYYETNPPLSEFSGAWKENQAVGLYTAQESYKLYDKRMKAEADKLAKRLNKLEAEAKKLKNYYSTNVKTEGDLIISPSFKKLYLAVGKELRIIEIKSSRLPSKYRGKFASGTKKVKAYRSNSREFIDGVRAGDKLVKEARELEKMFESGTFSQTMFAKNTLVHKVKLGSEKTISKMYGPHVRAKAKKKYINPAIIITRNINYELERYALLEEIRLLMEKGNTAAAKDKFVNLEAIEAKSKRLKQTNRVDYKTYPLVEKKLEELKKPLVQALNTKETP